MNGSTWFSTWFDSPHYRALYAHRDLSEASAFVDRLTSRLDPGNGAKMLDLGCGDGRHARHLAAKGFEVTGLDLAASSVRRARRFEHSRLRFFRHDMRAPFGCRTYDYVFNLFTSFGYFDTAADHLAVVRNIARALKPGGTLVLDYLNVRHVEQHLVVSEVKRIGCVTYRLSRWITPAHICKRIDIDDGQSTRHYVERVARFEVSDFQRMFALHGLTLGALYGDYDLQPYDATASPRAIFIARKRSDAESVDKPYLRERFLRMRLTVSGVTPRYDASMR